MVKRDADNPPVLSEPNPHQCSEEYAAKLAFFFLTSGLYSSEEETGNGAVHGAAKGGAAKGGTGRESNPQPAARGLLASVYGPPALTTTPPSGPPSWLSDLIWSLQ